MLKNRSLQGLESEADGEVVELIRHPANIYEGRAWLPAISIHNHTYLYRSSYLGVKVFPVAFHSQPEVRVIRLEHRIETAVGINEPAHAVRLEDFDLDHLGVTGVHANNKRKQKRNQPVHGLTSIRLCQRTPDRIYPCERKVRPPIRGLCRWGRIVLSVEGDLVDTRQNEQENPTEERKGCLNTLATKAGAAVGALGALIVVLPWLAVRTFFGSDGSEVLFALVGAAVALGIGYWLGGFFFRRFVSKRLDNISLKRSILWSNLIAWLIPPIGIMSARASHLLLSQQSTRQLAFRILIGLSVILSVFNGVYGALHALANNWNERANRLMEAGKLSSAKEVLDSAIGIDFLNDNGHLLRGRVLIAQKRYSEALIDLNKAEELMADSVVYKERAKVHYFLKSFQNGLSDIELYLRDKPEDGEAYALRAFIEMRLGQEQKANTDFEKAESLGVRVRGR